MRQVAADLRATSGHEGPARPRLHENAGMSTAPAADATRCPLCGAPNACAMEIARATGLAQPPCWCMAADFSDVFRAGMPTDARGLACICANCVATATAAGPPPAS